MRIDLHMHSTASDGAFAPAEVVRAAAAGGLHVIALADHDTTAGVAPALAAARGQLHVIPALEVSTTLEGVEHHVLGYYVDVTHPRILSFGDVASSRRRERMRGMIGRLEGLGVSVPFEEVAAAAGPDARAVGRPHLARALVERGYANSFADAFDRYIGDHGPAYLPTNLLTPADAIALIHEAGGVAIWAHPRPDALTRLLPQFLEWGLDGIECFRPRLSPAETAVVEGAARAHDLLVTGGSDWHGEWHGRLGTFAVSADDVAAFLARGGI